MGTAQSALGILVIPLVAWLISEDRAALGGRRSLRIVGAGLALQLAIGALLIGVPQSRFIFEALAGAVAALQAASEEGLRVVFGYLAGGPTPFEQSQPANGYILAFRALPLILLMSVLSRLLYHWGILQRLVLGGAWVLHRSLGIGGAVGVSAAANVFVGMVEAPLFVRPYLRTMDRGALFALMTVGMATVAGTVMALYAAILSTSIPGAAGHILAASVMSAPAALMIARLMVPQGFDSGDDVEMKLVDAPASTMDALAQGMVEGLRLLAYVTAMLVVMIALVALVNMVLALVGEVGGAPLTAQRLLGWAMMPAAWLIGIPWGEAALAGQLLGVKVVLNEFLAYLDLAATGGDLSERSRIILLYALCGFANFGSLGIMTGGLIAMAPERRTDILALGPKTILSGTLSTLLTGAVIGVLLPLF